MGVLPKPSELKKKPIASAVSHTKSRLAELSKEENRLVKSINRLRDEEEVLTNGFENRLAEIEEVHDTITTELSNEISALELKKNEAMRPLTKVSTNLDLREIDIKGKEVAIAILLQMATTDRKEASLDKLAAKALEELAHEKNQAAARLLTRLKEKEQELHGRKISFEDEQKIMRKEYLTKEMKLRAREKDVIRAEESLPAREENLIKLGKSIHDERRALDSQYMALAQAHKHLAKKK